MTEKRTAPAPPEAPADRAAVHPAGAGDSESADSGALAARELRAVFSRLRRTLREKGQAASGLTPSQTAVLSRLITDGPASASALAAAERVRPQSMAATLAVLEGHGLVVRRPDPEDGRRQLVGLSETGLSWIADSRRAREEWLARAFQEDFTEVERATVLAALSLLDRLNRR
ncbi:MarR family winged helix-turn-helix transcriptional regulator [Kitasatospora aureofaciens]|uniref:MarR family transcriptional regulator n=1 Tax=Kitasatospora aureofaciens TaxID=1894 RepID=A0A8H9LL84_KITAU|nr:MarR family transcriptional regulator [Kitasatospora aureofaciens]QEU98110.1 MarR family transcriptional regulator [Streptomyces viridifaciens]UKZ03968.1 MarR family transcriptional regulator [Streptomyces viridifaciens]GGU69743.1 MarR family transcriptional regulator [Kitasatospora aureofaciens]HJD82863.1 MarR family transcriptional regulator [Kitasatospora aureofaciens]